MRISVELTEEQEKFLKLFAKNQFEGANDNVCTVRPIHAVQTRKERVAHEEYNHDKVVYVVDEWEYEEFLGSELFRLVEKYYDYSEKEPPIKLISYDKAYQEGLVDSDGDDIYISDEEDYLDAYDIPRSLYKRVAVEYYYEDVAYFFILQSAKEYIKYQSHNLNRPRTYTKGGGYSNCGEYHHFWRLLMTMGEKLNKEESNENSNVGC